MSGENVKLLLSRRDFVAFAKAMTNPPKPNAALCRLMARK